ncbi:peptidase domain-containing ABC transporter [Okeania sp.]|uniref:peptidase domain-containing ABC transporter n=1 Tax=Okeania sp. TaxID=3100323 RepID=UPI002B4B436C|nr:peptidase domain-containing ABC transporter [Okeania sp.]MEB3341367.1 peptidase domain-containing ABC transporter [Okeania sp.]
MATSSTISRAQVQEFLTDQPPFNKLSENALKAKLVGKCQLLGYRTGQPLFEKDKMPVQVVIIYQGQARVLGYDQRSQRHISLQLAKPGEVLGWAGLLRGIPCETAIASTDLIAITLPAADFLAIVAAEREFGKVFLERPAITEVFDLLSQEFARRAEVKGNLKELTKSVLENAVIVNLPKGEKRTKELASILEGEKTWLVSSGIVGDFAPGSQVVLDKANKSIKIEGENGVRLLGFPEPEIEEEVVETEANEPEKSQLAPLDISIVPQAPPRPPETTVLQDTSSKKYPIFRAKGEVAIPLACFQMLAKHFGLRFRRDVIRRVLDNQMRTAGRISLQACGAIAQMMGLTGQLAQVPAAAVPRLKAPILVQWQESFAILYSITEKEIVVGSPEFGLTRLKPGQFQEVWGESGQVLLLQAPKSEQKEQFSFWWFVPSLMEHRTVFIEVLISSFFVQIFGLVNPLMTMIVIDKVMGQRNIDAMDVLGALMLLAALFEALLSGLRTFLFVDTTNRIDVKLSSEVIDHLLRLPLNYFDNRRVGDLTGRIGELANIRNFLTGTALTVVLDAVFSVIYIAVMLTLNPLMTAVALGGVPFFAGIILVNSPIVRRLLRKKAERYADSQSYLVEVLNGVQTVKAQNLELKSRWEWSARYARFMTASFNTVLTQTVSSSISSFLNKISGLALLWVGAYLAINGDLSVGGLIAFRIIAGNVTGSLLRFVSVWQSFQEVGMSIERLRDVLDTDAEVDEDDRNNIDMPPITGGVKFEELCFRFTQSGPLQLTNVNLDFPAGYFVGIVGLSGSGKSTLMKLLQRLYPPLSGRIFVDGYDIQKVELYSLRRQIGVVLQDTLLFNGTVQENIALTNPDATTDEIIRAAKVAVAHEFIMNLPNGYNTMVGERGASLSGGQRQRIAIARTVLQNPKLLILDEATSALDYSSERQVCENLAEAFQGETVFFITHRLTTVKNANTIIMMDKGSVVEQGTHDELMAVKGRYFCLYQQQEAQQ